MKIIEKDDYKIVKVTVTLDMVVGYGDEIYYKTPADVINSIYSSTSNDIGRIVQDSLHTAKIDNKMALKMNNKHRVNIAREAKRLIKKEIPNFYDLAVGEQESLLDEYIGKVCEAKGHTLTEFYFADGNFLNKILSI